MGNELKGPYKVGTGLDGWPSIIGPGGIEHDTDLWDERLANALNAAYAEGFKAGRASRDGLREALVAISSELYVNVDAATRCRQLAKKALAEDDKEGK
jgi:hypothetical protein